VISGKKLRKKKKEKKTRKKEEGREKDKWICLHGIMI